MFLYEHSLPPYSFCITAPNSHKTKRRQLWRQLLSQGFANGGGEGRDSNPSGGLTHRSRQAGRCLANGDLSTWLSTNLDGMGEHLHLRLDVRLLRIELSKDSVHNSSGQKNFAVRNRYRGAPHDRPVERLDQILHP